MMMMMNQGDEDEEVIFDQTGLLNNRLKPKASSQWCRRFTNTAFLSGAFFVLGLCIAVPGPTLLDLGDRVHADTKSITWIFSARSIGYLLGSIIGGVMFDYFDKQMLMCITLLLTSVATVSMPWCLTLVVLAVMTSVQGIAMGILDTGGNMFCIHLWGKMSAPYMQTLHFAFGIGAFIAPLLAKPFLAPIPANGSIDIVTGNIPTLTHLPNLISSPIPFTNETLQHRVRRGKTSLAAFNDSTNAIWESNQTDRTTTIPTLVATALPKKPEAASDKHLKGEYNDGKHMKEVAKPTGDIENKKVETDSTEKEFNTTTINGDISTNQRNVNFTGSNSSTVAKNPMSSVNMTNVNSSVTIKEKTGSIEANTSVSSGNHDVSEDVIHTDNSEETVNTAISSDASGKSSETVEGENKDGNETGDEEESKDTEETVAMHEADETGKANKTETLNVGKPDDKSGADKQKIDDKSGAEKPVAANNQYNRTVDEFGETSIPKTTVNITETQKKPETVTDLIGGAISVMKNMSRIQFAYLIIGLLLFVISILFLGLYCVNKHHPLSMHSTDDKAYMNRKESMGLRVTILLLLFLFFFMYVGMEVTYGGLILSFSVHYLKWTKDQAAIVTAIFWGSLASGRGFAIFVTKCFKPQCMLIMDLLFCLIGTLILCFGVPYYDPLLWAGTLILGLGMSSVFPTGVSWAENCLHLTGKSTAVFVVGSALGEMVIPIVTVQLFQFFSMMGLMYVMLALTCVSLVIYFLMECAASRLHSAPVRSSSLMALKDDVLDLDTFSTSTGAYEGLSKRHKKKSTFDEVEYGLLEQELED